MNKVLTALLLLLLTGTIAIVNLPDDCGYMEVVDDVVIIYTNCKISVSVIEEINIQKVLRDAEHVIEIYESENYTRGLQSAKVTIEYYQSAEDIGINFSVAKAILNGIEVKYLEPPKPSMDVIDGIVYLELPEGVAWRVIPE